VFVSWSYGGVWEMAEEAESEILGAIAEFLNTGPHEAFFSEPLKRWVIKGPLINSYDFRLPSATTTGMPRHTPNAAIILDGANLRIQNFVFDLNDPKSMDKLGELFHCEGSPKLTGINLICRLMDGWRE
jgi:hypothetical protein